MIDSDAIRIMKRLNGEFYIMQGSNIIETFKNMEEVFKYLKEWEVYVDTIVHPKMRKEK